MKAALGIVWSALRFFVVSWRLWVLMLIGIGGAVLGRYWGMTPCVYGGIAYYAWFLAWRRALACFVIRESQVSPSSMLSAAWWGYSSLVVAWPLTLWYGMTWLVDYGILCLHVQCGMTVGLFLVVFSLLLSFAQFFVDFLWIPLVADGVITFADTSAFLVVYLKKYWVLILQVFGLVALGFAVMVYGITFVCFLLKAPQVVVRQIVYGVFYGFLTLAQAVLYLKIHYLMDHA